MYSSKLPEKEKPSTDSHSLIPDAVLERLQTPFDIGAYDVRLMRGSPKIGDGIVTLTLQTDVL